MDSRIGPIQEQRMQIKVASLCPTTEKAVEGGELVHKYPYPGATLDEAIALANAMVDNGAAMLRSAAAEGAVMACLPEGLPNLGRWRADVETSQLQEAWRRTWDHFCRTIGDAARETGMIVVAGAVEPAGDAFYNVGAVFDEGGNIIGRYHKVQLATAEADRITPGESLPVFETRYGTLGVFICWDIMFPEVTQTLMLNGAEMLFEPTYGHSGSQADLMAQTRAYDSGCPLVISMWCGNGRIVDRDGKFLARGSMDRDEGGLIPDRILYAEIDPQAKRPMLDYDDYREGILGERRWDLFGPLSRPVGQDALDG